MKIIYHYFNSIKKSLKKITLKKVLIFLGTVCLMALGGLVGYKIYDILGCVFGAALGYVTGKLISHHKDI